MALNNTGMSHFKLGRYHEAIEYFNKAIEKEPYNVLATNNKGISIADLKYIPRPSTAITRL